MIGGYIGFWLFTLYGFDPFMVLPLIVIFLFLFGAAFYKLIFAQVTKFHEELKLKNSLLIAFGLSLIFPQIVMVLWTADERAISPLYSGKAFDILGIRFGYVPLSGVLVTLVVIIALQLFLTRTYFGKSLRGTAENWKAAKLSGINIDRTFMITFGLGISLAGLAGMLIGLVQQLTPVMGMSWTLKAMIVVVLAGMGSIGGAFIAGLILGIVEAVSAIFMGPYTIAIGMLIFLIILMVRPQGLFGRL
jgi:branched-chain amino acid transport system permease protein